MSVRSPVNVIPRDVLGIPILELSLAMSRLPPKFADTINAPLLRLLVGDIAKLGLKKLPYGPFEQIQKNASIPLLDIGTIKHIREGHITIHDIIPIEQFKSPGFSSQFLCIGPRAPAKHSDDAENNSKWIVLDDEHGGRFYW